MKFNGALSIILLTLCGGRATPEPATAPNVVAATTAPAVPAPKYFFALTKSSTSIVMYWANKDQQGLKHNVYRSTKADVLPLQANLIAEKIESDFYLDDSAQPGTKYFYCITAVDGNNESAPSNESDDETLTTAQDK